MFRHCIVPVTAGQHRKAIFEREERRHALLETRPEAAGRGARGRATRSARNKFGEAQSAAGERICETIVLPSFLRESKECKVKEGGKD